MQTFLLWYLFWSHLFRLQGAFLLLGPAIPGSCHRWSYSLQSVALDPTPPFLSRLPPSLASS